MHPVPRRGDSRCASLLHTTNDKSRLAGCHDSTHCEPFAGTVGCTNATDPDGVSIDPKGHCNDVCALGASLSSCAAFLRATNAGRRSKPILRPSTALRNAAQ